VENFTEAQKARAAAKFPPSQGPETIRFQFLFPHHLPSANPVSDGFGGLKSAGVLRFYADDLGLRGGNERPKSLSERPVLSTTWD
jgi:hypothetical protein